MALFKILKGLKANLPSTKKDGYCYFTTDDQMFYIDYEDANKTLQRKPLNANDAKSLTGATLENSMTDSNTKIPTSKAVLSAVDEVNSDLVKIKNSLEEKDTELNGLITGLTDNKMNKVDPTGSGKVSINGTATGNNAVSFGGTASGNAAIAFSGTASGEKAISEGVDTVASGSFSHAAGNTTKATHKSQFVIGEFNELDNSTNAATSRGNYAFLIGSGTSESERKNAITVKWTGDTWIRGSLTHGGTYAGGDSVEATGLNAHAEGKATIASGDYSHAEGMGSTASGSISHAEGNNTQAIGTYSHTEGNGTIAEGLAAHAEGLENSADGIAAHVEGNDNLASGNYSHAEGRSNTASGEDTHVGGNNSMAVGAQSFAHGLYVKAEGNQQVVFGKYNVANSTDAFIIGGGDSSREKNVFTVDFNGNAYFDATLRIGLDSSEMTGYALGISGKSYFSDLISVSGNYYPTEDNHLVNRKYVTDNLPNLVHVGLPTSDGQTVIDFGAVGIESLETYYLVYYNGLLLIEGIHYTIDGSKVVLTDWAARSEDICHVVGFAPLQSTELSYDTRLLIDSEY